MKFGFAFDLDGDLSPLSVLPCQIGDRLFATARLSFEKRLQLAVLEDAALTVLRLAGRKDARSLRLLGEVEEWFASDQADGPFTFVTICDTLSLNPDWIRRGLQQWQKRVGSVPRRPQFRRQGTGARRPHASDVLARVA